MGVMGLNPTTIYHTLGKYWYLCNLRPSSVPRICKCTLHKCCYNDSPTNVEAHLPMYLTRCKSSWCPVFSLCCWCSYNAFRRWGLLFVFLSVFNVFGASPPNLWSRGAYCCVTYSWWVWGGGPTSIVHSLALYYRYPLFSSCWWWFSGC